MIVENVKVYIFQFRIPLQHYLYFMRLKKTTAIISVSLLNETTKVLVKKLHERKSSGFTTERDR